MINKIFGNQNDGGLSSSDEEKLRGLGLDPTSQAKKNLENLLAQQKLIATELRKQRLAQIEEKNLRGGAASTVKASAKKFDEAAKAIDTFLKVKVGSEKGAEEAIRMLSDSLMAMQTIEHKSNQEVLNQILMQNKIDKRNVALTTEKLAYLVRQSIGVKSDGSGGFGYGGRNRDTDIEGNALEGSGGFSRGVLAKVLGAPAAMALNKAFNIDKRVEAGTEKVSAYMKSVDAKMSQAIKKSLPALGYKILGIDPETVGERGDVLDPIKSPAKSPSMLQKIRNRFSSGDSPEVDAIESLEENMDENFDRLIDKFSHWMTRQEFLDERNKKDGGGMMGMLGNLLGKGKGLLGSLAGGAMSLGKGAMSMLGSPAALVAGAGAAGYAAGTWIYDQFHEQIAPYADKFFGTIEGTAKAVSDFFVNGYNKVKSMFGDENGEFSFTSVLKGFKEALIGAVTWPAKMITKIMDGIKGYFKDKFKDGFFSGLKNMVFGGGDEDVAFNPADDSSFADATTSAVSVYGQQAAQQNPALFYNPDGTEKTVAQFRQARQAAQVNSGGTINAARKTTPRPIQAAQQMQTTQAPIMQPQQGQSIPSTRMDDIGVMVDDMGLIITTANGAYSGL